MSSPTGLNKSSSIFLQKYHVWPLPATEVQLQSRFSQSRGKILEKPGKKLLKTLCESWSSLFLLACESWKSTSFQNSWLQLVVFQRCVRLYFVTLVFFHPPLNIFWTSNSPVVLSNCSSFTNNKKTAIFDEIWVNQSFFCGFVTISPQWDNKPISPFQRRYSVQIFSVYVFLSLFWFVVHPKNSLKEKMSSPRQSQRGIFLSPAKVPIFAPSDNGGHTSESIFST